MGLVQRAQNILLRPRSEWPVIEQEHTDTRSLYRNYIVIVALLPTIAGLIARLTYVGQFGPRMGTGTALVSTVIGYGLSLLMVYVIALVADALAPTFGGNKAMGQALKLTAYAMTATWLGGMFVLVPVVGWLVALLGALYGLYLFYLGAPVLMAVPARKALGYTATIVVIALAIGFVIGLVEAALLGTGHAPAAAGV